MHIFVDPLYHCNKLKELIFIIEVSNIITNASSISDNLNELVKNNLIY